MELEVPRELQETTLQWHHVIPLAAYQGVGRMKAKLKKKFFCLHLLLDGAKYVPTCNMCSWSKKNKVYG